MTIAHFSDTHLGYFAYNRTDQGRLNQREVDIALAFKGILDAIAERDPDLVIHSGDLFHTIRPSNYSLIWAYRSIEKFQRKRNGRPFVIIGGNHDTPKSADLTSILQLFSGIEGVYVEFGMAATIALDNIEVLCFPSKALEAKDNTSMAPSLGKKFSVLTLHGVAKETNFDDPTFSVPDTRPGEWTYVAYGDFHVHTSYGPNACYAGSTEFTSTNIWEEARHRKGWVYFDSAVGKLEFVPSKARLVIDLPAIDAINLTGEQLGEAMMAQATWKGGDLPIVRQRVTNVLPEVQRQIPIKVIRAIDSLCLNYKTEYVRPTDVLRFSQDGGRSQTLEASWENHVASASIPADLDRNRLRDHGLELLKEVTDREAEAIEA